MAHTKDVLKKHKNVPKEKKKKKKQKRQKKIYIYLPYITRGAKVVMGGAKVGNCTPLPPLALPNNINHPIKSKENCRRYTNFSYKVKNQ